MQFLEEQGPPDLVLPETLQFAEWDHLCHRDRWGLRVSCERLESFSAETWALALQWRAGSLPQGISAGLQELTRSKKPGHRNHAIVWTNHPDHEVMVPESVAYRELELVLTHLAYLTEMDRRWFLGRATKRRLWNPTHTRAIYESLRLAESPLRLPTLERAGLYEWHFSKH